MRVMILQWPNPSHLYSAVPLAWALQGAGHEVCIASHADLAKAITAAGLTAVALGTPETMPTLDLDTYAKFALDEEVRGRLAAALEIDPDENSPERKAWDVYSTYHMIGTNLFHPPGALPATPAPGPDYLVEFAQQWRPDLVLWEPAWASAAVAARLCGAAHARLVWGLDYAGWAEERFIRYAPQVAAAGLTDPLRDSIGPIAERYGVDVDDDLLFGQWTVDPVPPQMRLPTNTRVVSVRRVPYTGVGVVPPWLYPRPHRPRIAISLGASVRTHSVDRDVIFDLLEMVGSMDVEVVATLDEAQLAGQQVPENIRTVNFLPLTQLLPTCSVVIHHGGGGTMLAAVAHRVPQLVVEGGGGLEGWAYGAYAIGNGAGLSLDPATQTVEEMRKRLQRVLYEPAFREGADRLHANWLAQPSPNDILPVLERLTAKHRGRG